MGEYPTVGITQWVKFIVQKLIFSVFISILFLLSAQAQEFTLGIKAGAHVSQSLFGDRDDGDFFDMNPVIGYQLSGIIGFPLKKNYSCIIEGGFSRHGRDVIFNEGSSKNVATYYYTDAALLLRRGFAVNLGKNVPSQIFVNVGPHINYWLSGTGRVGSTENEGSPYTVVFEQEPDLSQFDKMYLNNINRWLFGIDIGVGLQAPITQTQKLLVELRFTSGHTFYGDRNSATYSWVEFQDNLRANEKVLSLTAAYTFGFNIQKMRTGKSTKDKEVKRKPVRKKYKPVRKPGDSRIKIK
jgi:hypothetical protein